jgi:hypothetical protein
MFLYAALALLVLWLIYRTTYRRRGPRTALITTGITLVGLTVLLVVLMQALESVLTY